MKYPLIRIEFQEGKIRLVVIGPCAGRALVGVIVVATAAILILTGAVRWQDLVPMLRLFPRF